MHKRTRITWELSRPILGFTERQPRPVRPVRDLFVLLFLGAILALTFKREVNLAREKGWAATGQIVGEVFHELTPPW